MIVRQLVTLIDNHSPALVLFARQWCVNPEDVVQDAFCKLAAQRHWPDDPTAWLYRVVRNRAIDCGRADRRRQRREQATAKPVCWFDPDGIDVAEATAALEQLEDELREVIIARLWGGMTLDQIAQVMGCSVSTVHRRFDAGIAELRQKLRVPCPTNI